MYQVALGKAHNTFTFLANSRGRRDPPVTERFLPSLPDRKRAQRCRFWCETSSVFRISLSSKSFLDPVRLRPKTTQATTPLRHAGTSVRRRPRSDECKARLRTRLPVSFVVSRFSCVCGTGARRLVFSDHGEIRIPQLSPEYLR